MSWGLIYQVGKDALSWALDRFDPKRILEQRLRWKAEIENHLRWIDKSTGYGQAVIRNIRKLDGYPEVDKDANPHPWYRVGVKGLFADRFLEVFFGTPKGLKRFGSKSWRMTRDDEAYDVLASVVGRIPLEWIARIDWDGDEFYSFPHIYCRFKQKWGPYKQALFFSREEGFERPIYRELIDLDTAKKNLQRHLSREPAHCNPQSSQKLNDLI